LPPASADGGIRQAGRSPGDRPAPFSALLRPPAMGAGDPVDRRRRTGYASRATGRSPSLSRAAWN